MHAISAARKRATEALSDAETIAAGRAKLARLRAEAEAQIERLIELLDLTEPDVDIEKDPDDEPSFGSLASTDERRWSAGDRTDAEQDSDFEPSLGWTTRGACWWSNDAEEEHDGREPETDGLEDGGDYEPLLAATEAIDHHDAWRPVELRHYLMLGEPEAG